MWHFYYRKIGKACEHLKQGTTLWGSEQRAMVDSGTNDRIIVYGVWPPKIEQYFPPPPLHRSHPACSDGTGQLPTNLKGIYLNMSNVGLCENLNHSSSLEWKETALA